MGILSRFRRGGADLAAPRPVSPSPVEVGRDVGEFGGQTTTSAYIDEATRRLLTSSSKLTIKLASEMRAHHQVNACLLVQSLPILTASYTISHENDEVREWLTYAMGRIWHELARTIARCGWAGYSPNALVWDVDEATGGLLVKNIRDLDPSTAQPIVDSFGRYAGMVQNKGKASEVTIEPLESLWFVEGMESGNLYGRSLLTAAFMPWKNYQLVELFELRGLERYGAPLTKIRHPEGTYDANLAATLSAIAWNAEHPDDPREVPEPRLEDRSAQALALGEAVKNNSTVALPSGVVSTADGKALGFEWDLEFVESSAASGPLAAKLVELNKAIARGVFVPDLVLGDGGGIGSYALGQSHKGVWETSTDARLAEFAGQINRHLLRRLVEFNFPGAAPATLTFAPQSDSAEELWPIVEGMIERGELIPEAMRIAARVGIEVDEDATEAAAARRAAASAAPEAGADNAAHRHPVTLANDPQATAGGTAWRRPLTDLEKRINLRGIEDGMNTAEVAAVDAITEQLGVSRDRVLRQLAGILKAGGTTAEVITKLGTIDLGSSAPYAAVWRALQTELWTLGLTSVGQELGVTTPDRPGADGVAIIRELAAVNAERVVSQLSTAVRSALISAVRSGVTQAGAAALVMDLFDREATAENRGPRLTTRGLASRAVNEGRADGIDRGGVALRGAQYSAILDRVTCDLCERLDEQLIGIGDLDFVKFTPPLHHNCRCVWVYVTTEEAEFTPTWQSPPAGMVEKNGSLIVR